MYCAHYLCDTSFMKFQRFIWCQLSGVKHMIGDDANSIVIKEPDPTKQITVIFCCFVIRYKLKLNSTRFRSNASLITVLR